MRSQTISDKTVETVTQFHLHFDTPLLTPPFPLPFPLSQCCWVLSYVLQYISDQDKATLSLGGGERADFNLNVWISGWSTKKDTLSQQVLSEIVGRFETGPDRCFWTNFIHLFLQSSFVGRKCIDTPGVKLGFLGLTSPGSLPTHYFPQILQSVLLFIFAAAVFNTNFLTNLPFGQPTSFFWLSMGFFGCPLSKDLLPIKTQRRLVKKNCPQRRISLKAVTNFYLIFT